MADWQAIKTEYITTDTSYRKLADKYGIDQAVIARKGKTEGWVESRRQFVSETSAKIIDNAKKAKANRAAKIHSVADKLLLKIEAMVDRPEPLNEKAIRALTAAVKDLKEIQNVKSTLDEQEQEARIANLRRQVDKEEDESSVIEVVFAAGPEEWNE